jgi:hypothetical protein
MDAEASPPRSISTHLRGALSACTGAWRHAARLALDSALPTLCVACREPVDGEGVCANCWAKLSMRFGLRYFFRPLKTGDRQMKYAGAVGLVLVAVVALRVLGGFCSDPALADEVPDRGRAE